MNYLKEIIAFHHWLETNPLDSTEQALWFHLMDINNRCGWLEWFAVANMSLQARLGGIDRKTLDRKRNSLKQLGRIEYVNQGKREAGKYRMVTFTGMIPLEESITGNIPLETGKSVPKVSLDPPALYKQKKTKQKKIIPPKFPDDSQEMILALKLQTLILKNNDKARVPKDLTAWAAEFDKMIRIDGRPIDQLTAVMKFSQESTFWASNILSAKKLREKYDTLYLQSKAQPRGHPPGDLSKPTRAGEEERTC